MTESQRQGWLAYLSRGYLGKETENAIAPVPLPIPKGPGLHRICEPIDASVDIVFVHGLTGSSKTWYEPQSKTFWPRDLLPNDIPLARIFVWEYDADIFRIWINHHASANKLAAHGSNLCDRLAGNRYRTSTQRRPIVFICHSLGGLVVQKALLHSDECPDVLYNDIVDSTAGVIFLGTPHRGSNIANWGGLGVDFAHIAKDMNQAIMKLLKPDSEILFELRNSFLKLVIRRAQEKRQALKVKCYFEELGMTLIGKIVTEESAIFEGYPFGSIHANHVKMTKFGYHNGSADQAYVDVMEALSMMIDHAKFFHFPTRRSESLQASNRSQLLLKGIPLIPESLPVKLVPENLENIHHPMTASAVWNLGHASPSQNFRTLGQRNSVSKQSWNRSSPFSPVSTVRINDEQSVQNESTKASNFAPRGIQAGISQISHTCYPLSQTLGVSESIGRKTNVSDWLSSINHQEMHNSQGSQRYRETGVWLSKAGVFQKWRDSSQSSVFWLHGKPGAGKTILSSFVIDALSANDDVTVLYFYSRSRQFRNHVSILRSLLKQLYLRTNSKQAMEDFYMDHKDDTPCDGNETAIRIYYELFLKLLPTTRTYIVLDEVDVCTHDGIENLLNAWNYVSRRSHRVVKLFISSRKNELIKPPMERLMLQGGSQLSLDLNINQASDVDSYIDGQVEKVAKHWDLWQSSGEELTSHAKSMLKEHAGESFLWVRQVLEQMVPTITADSSGHDTYDPTSSSLPAFYRQFIGVIASENPVIASIAERTFYWLIFALEPLPAKDIAFAISLGLNDTEEKSVHPVNGARLAKCCKGMVTQPQDSDELLLVHLSAREFLCQHLDSSLAHAYLAKICLLALTSMTQQGDSANSLDDAPRISGEEGLFAYARRNYLIHGFKAISLDQRIGPYVDPDALPSFERLHAVGRS